MMELTRLSIAEAANLIQSQQLSPLELTQAHLNRIARIDSQINSFITLVAENALEQARQAEEEIARGSYLGALRGIPIALKDLYDTAGIRTTAGSKFFADHVPNQDAFLVRQLKHAGAIILGKTNMHEWALGVINDNPHYGAAKNPWDINRSPGGSSGGSAAALAAGLCMGALGSDTRGSIRIPAALCGIVGLKPTYGRLSLRGVVPLSWSLDHAGPMARTVEDVALLLQALTGYDSEDALADKDGAGGDFLSTLKGGITRWRIAVPADSFFAQVTPEIINLFRAAVQVFSTLSGGEVESLNFDDLHDSRHTSRLIVSSDAAAFHRERLIQKPEEFGNDVLMRLREGANFTAVEYAEARHAQAIYRHRLNTLFHSHELLLLPTVPMAAPSLNDPAALDSARASLSYYTAPFNMTGLPAISVPCGFTSDNLPIGLQIVGAPWREDMILRAAYAYERAAEWYKLASPLMGW